MLTLPTAKDVFNNQDGPQMQEFTRALADELIYLSTHGYKLSCCAQTAVNAVRTRLNGECINSWRIKFWGALARTVGCPLFFYKREPKDYRALRTHASFRKVVHDEKDPLWIAHGGFVLTGQVMRQDGTLMDNAVSIDGASTSDEPLFTDVEVVMLGIGMAKDIISHVPQDTPEHHFTEREMAYCFNTIRRTMQLISKVVAHGPKE